MSVKQTFHFQEFASTKRINISRYYKLYIIYICILISKNENSLKAIVGPRLCMQLCTQRGAELKKEVKRGK